MIADITTITIDGRPDVRTIALNSKFIIKATPFNVGGGVMSKIVYNDENHLTTYEVAETIAELEEIFDGWPIFPDPVFGPIQWLFNNNGFELKADGFTYAKDKANNYDGKLIKSFCGTLNGVAEYISYGDCGASSMVSIYIKMIVDNQYILSLDNTANKAVHVAAGVLTFGASLTASNITIDGVSKNAAEAGALLNDNTWHLLAFDIEDIVTDDVMLGRSATNYGNISVAKFELSELLAPIAEGGGLLSYDTGENEYIPINYVIWLMGQSNANDSSDDPAGSYGEPYDSDPIAGNMWFSDNVFRDRNFKDPYLDEIGPQIGMFHWFGQNYPKDNLWVARVAQGGSAIGSKITGTWYKPSSTEPWTTFVSKVPIIQAALPSTYIDLGVAWIQGEEDGSDATLAAAFPPNLDILIPNIEGEIGPQNWVFSRLSILPRTYIDDINDAYDAKVVEDPTKFYAINTDDLVGHSGGAHYDVDSMIQLGSRAISNLFTLL